jgi:CHAD domain-containing protein
MSGRPERPRKATAPKLGRKMNAAEAWREIARACLRQIRDNERGVLAARDPEYLHQFRIGWRRLRCALSMLRHPGWRSALAALRPDLRWLLRMLSAARNWDVFTTQVLAQYTLRDFAAFRARCARLRRRHDAAARAALRSDRYRKLMLDLGRLLAALEESAPGARKRKALDFAGMVLKRRHRKLKKKRASGSLAKASAAERHRLRIAAKKLRDASELLGSLFPGEKRKRYTGRLAELQDILGELNDLVIGARMAQEAAGAGKTASDARVAKLLRASLRAQERQKLADVDCAWTRFARRKPFWRSAR